MKKKIATLILSFVIISVFPISVLASDNTSKAVADASLLKGAVEGAKIAAGNKNLLQLNKKEITVLVGDSFDLNLNKYKKNLKHSYSSSNKSVAEVNKKTGVINATGEGNAIITCKILTENNSIIYLKCNVKVNKKTGINVDNLLDSAITGAEVATGNY